MPVVGSPPGKQLSAAVTDWERFGFFLFFGKCPITQQLGTSFASSNSSAAFGNYIYMFIEYIGPLAFEPTQASQSNKNNEL